MKPISVIGMGLSPDDLTARYLELIKQADILIGGKRHLDHFKDLTARKKDITKCFKVIYQQGRNDRRQSGIYRTN